MAEASARPFERRRSTMRCLLTQRRGRLSGPEQRVLARSLLRCNSFRLDPVAYRITRTAIDLVNRGQPAVMPAALAGRRCERRRDERRDPAHRDRDGVEADRQRDLEQLSATGERARCCLGEGRARETTPPRRAGRSRCRRPGNAAGAFPGSRPVSRRTYLYLRSLCGCSGVAAAQLPGGEGGQGDRVAA